MNYLLFIILPILSFSCKPSSPSQVEFNLVDTSSYLHTLDSLGYFKMTDPDNLVKSKAYLVQAYSESQFVDGYLHPDSFYNVDYRFYSLDNETLFEQGGLVAGLSELKPTFDKLGLKMEWSDEVDTAYLDSGFHSIRLNGTEYSLFEGAYHNYVWAVAAYNFAQMLNSELAKQGTAERVYLINGGNDGRLVFLTDALYTYVRSVTPTTWDSPMEPKE